MSKWIRGIYNAAANFNMSGSLRAARARTMDRDTKHVCEVSEQPDKSNIASESDKSCSSTTPCTGTTTCSRTTSASSSGATTDGLIKRRNCAIADFNVLDPNAECSCGVCRDYAEYTATVNAQSKGNSTGVWLSDESRDFKRSNSATTADVEHITGIQPGVTI